MYDTILVAADDSEGARAALAHAVDIAEAVDAVVHVVTVLDVHDNPLKFGVEEVDKLDSAAANLLEEVTATHGDRPVEFELDVLRGTPATTLLDHAEDIDADAIVAGQRGADGLAEVIVGSTTDRLAQLTDRPLLIVPADE